jgi:hypothetical protein
MTMTPDPRTDQYLAKVKEAEEQAAKSETIEDRESWLRIADEYRQLVELIGSVGGPSKGRRGQIRENRKTRHRPARI